MEIGGDEMSMIDDIKRDRDNGTPGPWTVVEDETAAQVTGFPCVLGEEYMVVGTEGMYGNIETDFANAKRIARVPDMEVALLAAEELAHRVHMQNDGAPMKPSYVTDALAAYRKATGDT